MLVGILISFIFRRALFDLLQKIALPLTRATSPTDFAARHGELVLKCIWKRSRSAETDLRKGKLKAADLFRILEDFLSVIDPKDWKERSLDGVPLGDMPLRTIKVLIQHIFGQSPVHTRVVYLILTALPS